METQWVGRNLRKLAVTNEWLGGARKKDLFISLVGICTLNMVCNIRIMARQQFEELGGKETKREKKEKRKK